MEDKKTDFIEDSWYVFDGYISIASEDPTLYEVKLYRTLNGKIVATQKTYLPLPNGIHCEYFKKLIIEINMIIYINKYIPFQKKYIAIFYLASSLLRRVFK